MKRWFSAALSLCLLAGLLAGCSNDSGGGKDINAPMGRYVEEQGEILENLGKVAGLHRNGAGEVVFYGQELGDTTPVYRRYVLPQEGGSLQKDEVSWLNQFLQEGERNLKGISEAQDGTVYLLYSEGMVTSLARSEGGGAPEKLDIPELVPKEGQGGFVGSSGVTIGSSGSITVGGVDYSTDTPADSGGTEDTPDAAEPGEEDGGEAEVPGSNEFIFDDSQLYCNGVVALEDGFLLLFGSEGVYRYGTDGVKSAEFPGVAYNSNNVAVYDNTLLMSNVEGKGILAYDMDTVKEKNSYVYESKDFYVNLGMDAQGIYLADSSGIYRQAEGGSIVEKLVDGGMTSLVMPNRSISGIVSDGGSGFWALLSTGENSYQLAHYWYDPDMPTNPDTELTIFSLKDNATVRQAIGEFQRANPNVRVNFRVAMDGDSTATVEDVIRALNTEILGGKGPDLLLLDGLPVDSYIEKGVLQDLAALAEGRGLMNNLLGAYRRDGKLYGIPSRFTFPVMMGAVDGLEGLNSLAELEARTRAGIGDEVPFLRAPESLWDEDGPGMLMQYYDACSGSFVKDGTIDEAALADFLRTMLELDKDVKEYTPQSGLTATIVSVAVSSNGGFEYVDMGPFDLKGGKARIHLGELVGTGTLQMAANNLAPMGGQKLDTLFGKGYYTPVGSVGIVAGSKQQELAKSFVELLLSPTVQDSYVYDGYPVNENSLQKLIQGLKDENMGIGLEDDMGFLDLCGKLDTPILVDQVIRDAVEAQAKSLLDGAVTPEEAAAKVVEKTRLYLAE